MAGLSMVRLQKKQNPLPNVLKNTAHLYCDLQKTLRKDHGNQYQSFPFSHFLLSPSFCSIYVMSHTYLQNL